LSGNGDKVFIEDIQEGHEVEAAFLVGDLRLGQTRNGKPFAALQLKDRTGRIEARVWDGAESFFQSVKNGDVALIRGGAESFQGRVQLKVLKYRVLSPEEVNLDDFRAASARDPDEMLDDLLDAAGRLTDPHLAGLMEDVLLDPDIGPAFKRAPAAKRFHHAYSGGLLEHTLTLVRAAEAISRIYPGLNRDLLVAGAIVHDLGKILEFDQGLSGDYTDEGRLVGHIVLGVGMIERKLAERPDFPPRLALLLKHMILSHHGEYEMGSPKRPKVLEALVLHNLDDLDAKINGIGGFIERHADEETGWTDFNRLMGRFFYRHDLPSAEIEPAPAAPAAHKPRPRRAEPSERPDPNQLSLIVE